MVFNVEVAAKGTMVECPVSIDEYEQIFETSSMTEELLQGVAISVDNIK